MKDIKILISSILIIVSFFVWYFLDKNSIKQNIIKKNYINLEMQKTWIKVYKNNNTIVTVDWEILIWNKIKFKK